MQSVLLQRALLEDHWLLLCVLPASLFPHQKVELANAQ